MTILPKCTGAGCPLKLTCDRYKPNVDKKKEEHFSVPPYDSEREKCSWHIEPGIEDSLSKRLNDLKNGNQN
jgi:hypothetical protein